MSQFAVYKNKNPQSKSAIPFLLDVQNELLSDLNTRVVVPLYPLSNFTAKPIAPLMPIFEIDNDVYVMLTPQLAGIAKADLGPAVVSLASQHHDIVAALDFLITGF